ncbi:hypothetical protein J1N35_029295 [Gossypium stocksii]|uniref:Uncharacterized protein n=1 Tax=Gossypium stocksii TaxID=47602 RepID=A0A9D3UXK2_9ROSI|nr:hypothetical protein J1N35_029295 [Gossypium stocksii]
MALYSRMKYMKNATVIYCLPLFLACFCFSVATSAFFAGLGRWDVMWAEARVAVVRGGQLVVVRSQAVGGDLRRLGSRWLGIRASETLIWLMVWAS